ncbi:MAG: alkaline phosphatase family protein [Saprospiraceae bacterium]|nr:alkaline phosphatase family protein [Lewinella sp.]
MRKILFFISILFTACQATDTPSKTIPKAVFIILDGIPADVLEKVETPVLDEIAGIGGYTRAYVGGDVGTYNETPTISAPGYTDLLTATWANKHNVWDNYDQQPNYHYWNIFRTTEQHNPDLKTAIFSTWLDNRTILVGEGTAGDFKIDYAADGFEKDTIRFPHDDAAAYIHQIDELVTDEAARTIRESGPDLSWVYLEYTDDMGHAHGDSEEFYQAVRTADAQVGKIWEAIKERKTREEDWMIVITTDHGRDAESGKDHGGQSSRERTTWIVTNASPLNERFTAEEPAIVDITPSILHHLGISPPESVRNEMDGISFLGDVSLDQFKVELQGKTLKLSWHPFVSQGEARVLMATTNHYRTGGQDQYQEIVKIGLWSGQFETELTDEQWAAFEASGFMKILIEAPSNRANYWLLK